MKKLVLGLLVLLASLSASHAQTGPEDQAPLTAFADSINAVFQAVDKSRIPSGILEEYGLQLIDHVPFTGSNGFSAANQLDINRWRAIYGDLYGARINANAQNMPSLATVNQQLALYARDAYVELPILHFDYNSIRTDALSSGAIQSVNNRLYDVAGQNPYQINTAFAVAASAASLPSATASFVFRPDLFWTNSGRTVAGLEADFADGNGFVTLSWNAPRTISYGSAGDKDVRVRVHYTNGSTYESHLLVRSPAPVVSPVANATAGTLATAYTGIANVSFNLTADKSYQGQRASAQISIEYSGSSGVLDKPLIVVKGFDLSGFLPITHTTYSEFISKQFNTDGVILSNGANADGYDIVYVDFDNGTDYIQRNAYLLETVINWVNQHKTGTQPNTMLAMSMGGLVAQYALRDMEKDLANAVAGATPHQVRLLITHDAPHQGGNVPLSVQMLIRQLAGTSFSLPLGSTIRLVDRYPVLGQARDALLSPAAQQLLRYQTTHLGGSGGFANFVVAAPTSLYDSFQQEYQALLGPTGVPQGTPGQPCRVVACANGSECGRPQPFGPYAMLASLTYDGNATNFGLLDVLNVPILSGAALGSLATLGVISGPAGIVGVGIISLFALGLTGSYDLTAALNLRALPDQQALSVCDIFLQANKHTRLLGLFRVQITFLEYHGTSLASQLPLDSGSGGVISLAAYAQQIGGATTSLPAGLLQQQQFCFTPTFSTLNITPSSSAALTAQYSPGTNVGTPFANFRTAGRENELHLQYTALNSSWMLKELRQTPQVLSCSAFCQAEPAISGPTAICSTGATYSIPNLPPGTTVNWQLKTTGAVSTTSGTGPTFTVSSTGGGSGGGVLTATLVNDCGTLTRTLNVYAGVPETPLFDGPTEVACTDYSETYTITNYSPALTYTVRSGGVARSKPVLARVGTFQVLFSGTGSGYVNVTATNSCGSVTNTLSLTVDPCATFAATPNPSSSQLTVTATDPAAEFDADLYDTYGRKLKTKHGAHGKAVLEVAELPDGLYNLRVGQGKGAYSQHIQIKH
ncbi:T9SS type A sorting domain-containing protein (plasmid) [Hymenobacter sp. BRD128]|uniref:T9SS type A sorting domain-containing protein n=1 Tax=Hymenobacter sp. BRD128 TaxID=2675878 RepID=UPI0015646965|nr:T9SS type A sorting domain-containing protein [Hymenobacter sp. BRD128]QKG59068.1 T9SS type A sorting domain-containing protein [Hymenobacter sp. BRD128]